MFVMVKLKRHIDQPVCAASIAIFNSCGYCKNQEVASTHDQWQAHHGIVRSVHVAQLADNQALMDLVHKAWSALFGAKD